MDNGGRIDCAWTGSGRNRHSINIRRVRIHTPRQASAGNHGKQYCAAARQSCGNDTNGNGARILDRAISRSDTATFVLPFVFLLALQLMVLGSAWGLPLTVQHESD